MRVLNLYAGIGGNRKLWSSEVKVVAVEINPSIAEVYKKLYPSDEVIVADAHKYLLEHYEEFDFIWSSPPCPSHSRMGQGRVLAKLSKARYPDQKLWQEIIFLRSNFKGLWVVENVISYYEPVWKPYVVGRHYFWSNFFIDNPKFEECVDVLRVGIKSLEAFHGISLQDFKVNHKRLLLRNCVQPKVGLYIWNCAFKEKQEVLRWD